MGKIRILHTSDIHIGRSFGASEKSEDYQGLIWKALDGMVAIAMERDAQLFLIAGDTLDSTPMGQAVLSRLAKALAPLNARGIEVVMIPGTHDPLKPGCDYKSQVFSEQLGWVKLLTWQKPIIIFDDIATSVEAWFGDPEQKDKVVKPESARSAAAKFKIGMAHGSLRTLPWIEDKDLLIREELIEQSGLDYLALGHWHSYQDFKFGKTIAAYPGVAEPSLPEFVQRYFEQAGGDFRGSVAWVEISDEGTRVEKLEVGNLKPAKIELPADKIPDPVWTEEKLKQFYSPEAILFLTLSGRLKDDQVLDKDQFLGFFRGKFFWIKMVDRTEAAPEVRPEELRSPLEREFCKVMMEMLTTAAEDEKPLHNDAVRKGMALLRGKI